MNRAQYMNQNRMPSQRMMHINNADNGRTNMCGTPENRSNDCRMNNRSSERRQDCGCNGRSAERRQDCGCNERSAERGPDCGCLERSSERRQDCGCEPQATPSCPTEISTKNRRDLLCFINEVSFAAYDMMLYLDTHPCDSDALAYFHKNNRLRCLALEEYTKRFGPLTLSLADECKESTWQWIHEPWPWEGGIC